MEELYKEKWIDIRHYLNILSRQLGWNNIYFLKKIDRKLIIIFYKVVIYENSTKGIKIYHKE